MSTARPEAVQELLDHHAIVQVTHRYCWALDTRSFEQLDTVFLPDATASMRSTELVGRDAIRARVSGALTGLDGSQHTVANHIVDIRGDQASCRCYVHAQHVKLGVPGGELYVIAGHYLDELVRTPDGWRIAHRTLRETWHEGNIEVLRSRNRPAPS